jgi:hypothetical protein
MRTKRAERRKSNSKTKTAEVPYDYVTRGDSNGKMQFLEIEGTRNDLSVSPVKRRIKKVKPYSCALAQGTYRGRLNLIDEHGEGVIPTHSDLLYSAFAQDSGLLPQLLLEAPFQKAINGAINSAQRYGDVLLLVSAAEAKKTYSMLRTIFVDLYNFIFKLYKSVKKLNLKDAYQILSDAWLSYRYGFKPLYLELTALYGLLVDTGLFRVRSSYGTSKDDINFSYEAKDVNLSSPDYDIVFDMLLNFTSVTHKAGFNYFNSKESRNVDKFAVLGLDIQSILSTAYELIPFSFVLDMFVNIGDLLQGFDVQNQVNPINGYITSRYIGEFEYKVLNDELLSTEGYSYIDRYYFDNWETTAKKFRSASYTVRSSWSSRSYNYRDPTYGKIQDAELAEGFFDHIEFSLYDDPVYITDLVHEGKVIDRFRFASYSRTDAPSPMSSQFWAERLYRVETDGVIEIITYFVMIDPPIWFLENYIGPISKAGDNTSLIKALVPQYHIDLSNIIPGITIGPLFLNNVQMTFAEYCMTKGSCPQGHNMPRFYVQEHNIDLAVPYDTLYCRRFPNRTYDPPNAVETPPYVYHSFLGEFITRVERESFLLDLHADLDLSKSQVADLLIFSERLVTALRKRTK